MHLVLGVSAHAAARYRCREVLSAGRIVLDKRRRQQSLVCRLTVKKVVHTRLPSMGYLFTEIPVLIPVLKLAVSLQVT